MRLLGSARYFRSHLSHKMYGNIVSHHRLYRMSISFMRTDVKEKERERERERKREEKYATEKTKLFLRLLRLRKTEIIMTLSDLLVFVLTIIAFRARRKRRKKNGTKSRPLHICLEAYARERVLYLISAQQQQNVPEVL